MLNTHVRSFFAIICVFIADLSDVKFSTSRKLLPHSVPIRSLKIKRGIMNTHFSNFFVDRIFGFQSEYVM